MSRNRAGARFACPKRRRDWRRPASSNAVVVSGESFRQKNRTVKKKTTPSGGRGRSSRTSALTSHSNCQDAARVRTRALIPRGKLRSPSVEFDRLDLIDADAVDVEERIVRTSR